VLVGRKAICRLVCLKRFIICVYCWVCALRMQTWTCSVLYIGCVPCSGWLLVSPIDIYIYTYMYIYIYIYISILCCITNIRPESEKYCSYKDYRFCLQIVITSEIRFFLLYQLPAVLFSRSVAHLFLQHPYIYCLNFVYFYLFYFRRL